MTELMKLNEDNKITSLELVEQINFFRKDIEGKSELKHYDLLKVIRDEFEEEINELKIQPSSYVTQQNKQVTMYELTKSQAFRLLIRMRYFSIADNYIDELDIVHLHTRSRFAESFDVELMNAMNYLEVECLREYTVSKYRVDWYLPEYNIVIEYDERHHLNNSNIEADTLRQEIIEKEIGCTFVRLDYRERDSLNLLHVVMEIIKHRKAFSKQ